MKDRISAIIDAAPGAQPDYIEETEWFDDRFAAVKAINEYEKKFISYIEEFRAILGDSDFNDSNAREEIDSWYPEAIRLHGWRMEGKTVFLALVQHDQETPVALELNCYTDTEIEELKE